MIIIIIPVIAPAHDEKGTAAANLCWSPLSLAAETIFIDFVIFAIFLVPFFHNNNNNNDVGDGYDVVIVGGYDNDGNIHTLNTDFQLFFSGHTSGLDHANNNNNK